METDLSALKVKAKKKLILNVTVFFFFHLLHQKSMFLPKWHKDSSFISNRHLSQSVTMFVFPLLSITDGDFCDKKDWMHRLLKEQASKANINIVNVPTVWSIKVYFASVCFFFSVYLLEETLIGLHWRNSHKLRPQPRQWRSCGQIYLSVWQQSPYRQFKGVFSLLLFWSSKEGRVIYYSLFKY